jgi:hypothetical protein
VTDHAFSGAQAPTDSNIDPQAPESATPRRASVILVLGGARSGKSGHAEGLVEAAAEAGVEPVYLATAEAGDAEMTARITARGVASAGARWKRRSISLPPSRTGRCVRPRSWSTA